jgi:hypothetical protein
MKRLDAILLAGDCMAVLTRDVAVRLVDISGSGCLLESDSRLREGVTGTLHVVFENVQYTDDVRIVRCTGHEGSQTYRMGAEFLWTRHPGERSLRRVLTKLQASAVAPRVNGFTARM